MSDDAGEVTERRPLEAPAGIPDWDPWPSPTVRLTTGSTMVDVAHLAEQGAPEGTVVVAEEQTAGRGRRGRAWESERYAGIWLSLLLRPPAPADQVGWLPLVAGLGVARAIRSLTDIDVRLKWPNDIVVTVDGEVRKLAGLLAERLADGAVVIGIGINVLQPRDSLPEGGSSLRVEGATVSREAVLVSVLSEVAAAYREWLAGHDVAADYAALSATLGARVRVRRQVGDLVGRAVRLGPVGELVVSCDDGEERAITAGDVVHLRPAGPFR